jgi:apolipoprotein N-acyltransferase
MPTSQPTSPKVSTTVSSVSPVSGSRFSLAPYTSCLVGGALLGLAFPTYPFIHLEVLAWIAFVPILFSLKNETRFGGFYRKAYFSMMCFTLVSVWWVALSTPTGGGLMYFAQTFFNTVPLILFFVIRKYIGWRLALWSLPFVWTAWEWRYLDADISFGWITLGNSQSNLTWLIQHIDLFGVWIVSFWIMLFNVLILFAWEKHIDFPFRLKSLAPTEKIKFKNFLKQSSVIAVSMLAFPLFYSAYTFSSATESGTKIPVTIVQPNIDPFSKWANSNRDAVLRRHIEPTDTAAMTTKTELFVWPETAIPYFILMNRALAPYQTLQAAVQRWQTPLLTGLSDATFYSDSTERQVGAKFDKSSGEYYDTFNSSMLMQPATQTAVDSAPVTLKVYHKTELVPFAERVPYMEYLPFLAKWTFDVGGVSSWGRGNTVENFQFITRGNDTVKVCGMICYESIYPDLAAKFVQRGATMLTVITNDGWFSKSYGPYQHAAFAKLRCIETRRAMARCANTGISLFIDKFGRGYGEVPWWEAHVITEPVELNTHLTFYVTHVDYFPALCGVVTLLVLGLTFFQAVRRKGNDLKS